MATRRSARTMVRAPKRSMFWEGAHIDFTLATGLMSMTTVVAEATLENVPQPTLIRVRGQFQIERTAQGATPASCNIAMGLLKVTAKAFAAGAASVSAAGTDIGSDWLWHKIVPFFGRASVGAESGEGATEHRLEIDNKAMRKFDNNELLVLVVENVALTSTMTVGVTGGFRVLFKK